MITPEIYLISKGWEFFEGQWFDRLGGWPDGFDISDAMAIQRHKDEKEAQEEV